MKERILKQQSPLS